MILVPAIDNFIALVDLRVRLAGDSHLPTGIKTATIIGKIARANTDIPRTFVQKQDFVAGTLKDALMGYAADLDREPGAAEKLFGPGGYIQSRRVTERFNTRQNRRLRGELEVAGHIRSVYIDAINATLWDDTILANLNIKGERESGARMGQEGMMSSRIGPTQSITGTALSSNSRQN